MIEDSLTNHVGYIAGEATGCRSVLTCPTAAASAFGGSQQLVYFEPIGYTAFGEG